MTTELEQELAKLKYGDHICLIYETARERLEVSVAFVLDGLARGERCVYILDESGLEEIVQALTAAGVDVALERRRGALQFTTTEETFLRSGRFVAQAMMDIIREAEAQAIADGFTGVRITGEPPWSALGPDPGDGWFEYEALLSHLPGKSVILCRYNLSCFEESCIPDVLQTHPGAILGNQVCTNPYHEPSFVPSQERHTNTEFKRKRAAWWIAELKRTHAAEQERERALEELKQSERRLAEAQRVAHIGSWERDLRTNQVTWSNELYRLFGVKAGEIELSYERFLSFLVPQDVDRIRALVDEAIRQRGPLRCDYRIKRPDGSVRVLHEQGTVIVNEAGVPIRLVGTVQDVTEQRHTEEMLEENRRRYLAVFENALDPIVLVDDSARFVEGNPAACALLGYTREEFVQLTVFDVTGVDDHQRVQEWLDRLLAEGAQSGEITEFCKDGTTREVEYRSVANILPGLHLCVHRDITERKRAEKALRQSEDRIRLVIDTIPVMAWSVQPGGAVDFLNRRWTDYTGLSLEQYVAEPTRPIHPEDIPRVMERWRAQMAAGEGYEDEMRLRRADGEYRWFLVRTEPVRDEQGDIVKWYGVSADIDDRKLAEQAVKDSQQLLHKVLTTLPVGVLVTDREASVILANPAYEHTWGGIIVSGRERWAQSKGFWHESGKRIDPESWASARALSKGETSLNELIDIEAFDGQQKTIQNSAAPIQNAQGQIMGAVVVNEDVTERVRAEKALHESAVRLQHLSRRLLEVQEEERRHLARELHDEIGQTLTGLRLILKPTDALIGDAGKARFEHARTLVDGLLATVRSLSFDLRPAALDQLGLLPGLLALCERYTKQTGVLVNFKHQGVDGRFAPEVETTTYRIVQEALTNVARHAAVASVDVRVWATADVLSAQIEDRGRGFDAEDVLARPRSGGLPGMQERVALLGGRLTIESRPGAGTQITAELPLSKAEGER